MRPFIFTTRDSRSSATTKSAPWRLKASTGPGDRDQLRGAVEQRLATSDNDIHTALGSVADTARAVVAAYDGVATQLILDGDLPGARAWLRQLLMVILTR
ncbi:MAG TPA: hypothetical protein VEI45_26255 [Mycobacterium sp.]|uniref:hypothetical protein n=1 Tax=Mycobacterium sp. TaxID=1785 RepID=UPI002D5DBD2F|nr:hypothetical protein [Mycobacterium sp.]HXY67776.1 hypothetical protein [Mycobacterium sp.]